MASLDGIWIGKRYFFTFAYDVKEHERNSAPTDDFVKLIAEKKTDIYTFLERSWCCPIANPPKNWLKAPDNVALVNISTYDEWLTRVGKKTRNMIRKAEKAGIKIEPVEPSEKLAEGIWKIYNESPIRQERPFPHYGKTLEQVKAMVFYPVNGVFIAAYLDDELTGFIHLIIGDQIGIISQILSMQKHQDKAVNNALLAKAIEVCTQKKIQWAMYGRIGNHPSLDKFKESNGFVKYPINRYFLILTRKGRFAAMLGLHRELKDRLPDWLKIRLFPVYNWVTKTKAKTKKV